MKQNSRAQISMSFNWIFVMIIGIVFLTFFFSIISSQSKSSEQKVSATISKQFETIIGTTSQKAGTFKTYKTSPMELNFYCNELEDISYYAVKDTLAGYTTHDVLFSPAKLKGTSMYTWTQEWSYPFSIMNFLYVTNRFQLFIFYDQGPYENFDTLLNFFPKNLSIFMMNDSIQPKASMNNDLYTYVFFKDQLDDIEKLGIDAIIEDKSQIVIIDPSSFDVFGSGKIYFTTGDYYRRARSFTVHLSEMDSANYYGKASLYGALFSGEQENYVCNMNKAFTRMSMMNELNLYRAINTLEEVYPLSYCNTLYNGSVTYPYGLKQLLEDFSSTFKEGFSNIDKDEFVDLVKDLEDKNSRLLFEGNCPGLY